MPAFLLSLTIYAFPPVLMYHRVDIAVPRAAQARELTVTPDMLDEQMRYLRAHGLNPISMADYERRVRLKEPTDRDVIVTFDDGYADQYTYAFPVLVHDGADATFYVVTRTVGRASHVTWPELKAMLRTSMDIEPHGETHDDLALMNERAQRAEIDGSIADLESRLGVKAVTSYAYPSGEFNAETLRLERAAHVPVAVTTDPRNVIRPKDALEVVRIRVRGDWTLGDFARAVQRALMRPQVLPQ